MAVISTSEGKIKLIDLKRNRIMSAFNVGTRKPYVLVFSLDWNKDGFLAVGSSDLTVSIMKFLPEQNVFSEHTKVPTNCECRRVSFSPTRPYILSIALYNGKLLIYDMEKT
jgi:WD40 repeat protein